MTIREFFKEIKLIRYWGRIDLLVGLHCRYLELLERNEARCRSPRIDKAFKAIVDDHVELLKSTEDR